MDGELYLGDLLTLWYRNMRLWQHGQVQKAHPQCQREAAGCRPQSGSSRVSTGDSEAGGPLVTHIPDLALCSGEPGSMTVTWTTWVPAPSEVQFGLQLAGPLGLRARGSARPFVDGGILRRKLYIHRVTLRRLLPGVQYVYRCGSAQGWSRRFRFRALKTGVHWSPRLAVFGDLGADNPKAFPRLRRDTQQGLYDAVLHVGDFAYNMDQDNARVGDRFMRLIEPVAASLPYMTCPGNHEERYNFSNYKARFSMPGDNEGLWYSWDLGPAHIISFSTEVYFFLHYGRHLVQRQFHWLESDLQKANQNRAARPWIITMGHRPMYCSNADLDDCRWHESKVRKGLRGKLYGLEDLFYKYGVDLQLWAHEHSYERLWPIYNYQVLNGSLELPYTNPRGPVHIITGSAGCEERLTPFAISPGPWSAVRVKEYGYTRLHVLNGTHVHIQQVSDDQDGKIVDDVWVPGQLTSPRCWHRAGAFSSSHPSAVVSREQGSPPPCRRHHKQNIAVDKMK
ncbi:Iron/zinc purple acid phosphatase-like protein [Sciurus carolinensis]|uniref:Purple acid phosphatase n=1 Tax=Sciurus carolinensis TaxID=30640 RepID=A0AA41NBJ6_SCICA|nr:Iron/zinc purple acid phosphatase-like protein [Sciurus carolinensis]